MEAVNVIDRAIELIEIGWTQGAYARDREQRKIGVLAPAACTWCLSGALSWAFYDLNSKCWEVLSVIDRAVDVGNYPPVPFPASLWNDMPGRTQDDVLALLRTVREQFVMKEIEVL